MEKKACFRNYIFEIACTGAHTQALKKLIGKHLVTIKIYYK